MVRWLYSKVIHFAKWMQHAYVPIFVHDWARLFVSKHYEFNSITWQNHELLCLEQETFDSWFPQLIALIPILDQLCIQVNDEHIVSIDSNHLEANHKRSQFLCYLFFEFFIVFFVNIWFYFLLLHIQELDICIGNIKHMVPSDKLFALLIRFINIKYKQVETKLIVSLICQYIKFVFVRKDIDNLPDVFRIV